MATYDDAIRLQEENQARRDAIKLREENQALRGQLGELSYRLGQLQGESAALREENATLRAGMAALQDKHDRDSSRAVDLWLLTLNERDAAHRRIETLQQQLHELRHKEQKALDDAIELIESLQAELNDLRARVLSSRSTPPPN